MTFRQLCCGGSRDFRLFIGGGVYCINLMLKDKPTTKNRIVSWLYKKALLSQDFRASVTSVEYGKWLNKKLDVDCKYDLIHDIYRDYYEQKKIETEPNTVFCGGSNGRDWQFIFDVAKGLPDIKFNVVMNRNVYESNNYVIPSNVNVFCDITYQGFLEKLCSSKMVCLPLNTEAPAGLIVMFQAAANEKLVITTKTVTSCEYVTEERGEALTKNIAMWQKQIKYYMEHEREAVQKAKNFKVFLKKECTEEIFAKQVNEILSAKEIH